MSVVGLVFPHQLFQDSPVLHNAETLFLIEEYLFFRQYPFHKQKIAFHRATMKAYADELIRKGKSVKYIEAHDDLSDVRVLLKHLSRTKASIHYVDPTDFLLEKRIKRTAEKYQLESVPYENPQFLNTRSDLGTFFKPEKKKFFQTAFYKKERQRQDILLDNFGKPVGGKWTYDVENRKKYPKGKMPPPVQFPDRNSYYEEAKVYTEKYFPNNYGKLSEMPLFPHNYEETQRWYADFLKTRFYNFGIYEDAIVAEASILNHSVMTPMLNVGLILPHDLMRQALDVADTYDIPLNSLEGFLRQIMGWREFIRGMYEAKSVQQRTTNYWGFTRKIPSSFYTGNTGIPPVDITIRRVLETGYCHHIERLMVLGNFMLLCEFDPDEVYRWFMELFVDAYDWVMVPNVYGMSQFADGGLFATKPYIAGSNYILKMSNHQKGDWQKVWDGLFWRFIHIHRDFFVKNPRLRMLVRNFDKLDSDKRNAHLEAADAYLDGLSR